MSVYKPHPGSPYWADFELPDPFGRVKVNTLSDRKREARAREGLLRELYRSGQHQTLRAVIAGDIDVALVVAGKREKRLDNDGLLADLHLRAPLWPTLRQLFGEPEPRRGTQRHRYLTSATKLERLGIVPRGTRAKVRDLGRVEWEAVLDAWPDSEADYNHMRRMLSRALTLLLGDVLHPARRAIMKAVPRAKEPRSRKHELSVPRFLEIIERVRPDLRAAYWTMLVTGMRTGEYLRCGPEHKRADLHMVDVPGRKTEGSAALVAVDPRLWPWVEAGIPAPLDYKWLRIQWKRACKAAGYAAVRLHDIRHLTATAGLTGGASLADVQALMRHANPAMTMDYAVTMQSRAAASGLANVLVMAPRRRPAAKITTARSA